MSKSDAFPGLSTLDALGITAPDRASKRTSTKVTARVEAIAQGFGKGRAVIVTGDKGARPLSTWRMPGRLPSRRSSRPLPLSAGRTPAQSSRWSGVRRSSSSLASELGR
jgi:hypothetical protein